MQNENKTQLPAWLQSSQDPATVSNRVRGIVLAASSIIIFAAGLFFHVTLTAGDIVSLASELGAVAGAIWTIYGAVIWALTFVGKKN